MSYLRTSQKWLLIFTAMSFFLSSFLSVLLAAPVDENTAKSAALGWLNHTQGIGLSAKLTPDIESIDTFKDDTGDIIYYVINLKPDGYIVVSPDDQIEPIITFSQEGRYDPNPENPLYVLLNKDMKGRNDYVKKELPTALKKAQPQNQADKPASVKHAEKSKEKWTLFLSKQIPNNSTPIINGASPLSSINDVRIDKLVQSRWDQSTAGGYNCYNYYTPNHYVCGCVATAMSQVMRFHQYPVNGIGVHSFSVKVNGSDQNLDTRGGNGSGGAYDWSNMPLVPASGSTDAQRQMIGSLCYDAGLTVHMMYTSSSSGAYGYNVAPALKNTFGYANAIYGGAPYVNPVPNTDIYNMANTNLDAGYPVILSINSSGGAHEIVCDGYGFNSSTPYHHLNMGWSGAYDQWYNLPTITTFLNFDTVYECTYNVFPSGAGEIVSGRVLDESGTPVSGVTVETGIYSDVTDSKGIYALKHIMPGTYTITTAKSGYIPASLTKTIVQSVDRDQIGNMWGVDITIIVGNAPPTVTSDSVDSITSTTATITGQVRSDNGATVTDRGFCWDTSQNPVITGNVLPVGSGTGKFSGSIIGLIKNTIYYVRAYATNSYGTSYGKNLIFVAADVPKMVLYGMGLNNHGQLGDGTTNNQVNPESIGFYTVSAVSAGGASHSLFIKDGSLFAMGWNGYGQLGDGTTNDIITPKKIVSSGVKKIAAGNYHSIFLKDDGTVWGMGCNNYGQLGDGTTNDHQVPTQITGIDNIVDIAASSYNSFFLKSDGTLLGTGWNGYGQLGDGTIIDQSSPIVIISDVNTVIQSIAAGEGYTLFIKTDGSLWGMGSSGNGQLGRGNTDILGPTQIVAAGATTVTAVSAGNHSLFLKSDGSMWGMGYNGNGQLGIGNKTTQIAPQPIIQPAPGAPTVKAISAAGGTAGKHSLFIMDDGSLWGMGYNGNGQLGNGTTTDSLSPVQILSSDVTVISAGSHSLFLKNRALFNVTFVGGAGTITGTKNQLVLQGSDAEPVSAVPNTGYHFVNWTGTGTFQPTTANPLTVSTVLEDMTITANFAANDVQIATDVSSLNIYETGTATFQVKLTAQPASSKTVTVARTSGDANVSVNPSSASLTFTTANWNTYQPATLSSAKDTDLTNSTATITLSSPGSNNKTVSVSNVDTDTTLVIRSNLKGTTNPVGTVLVTKNVPSPISASAITGYHFTSWTVISGAATFGNANVADTTVTIPGAATIYPNFALNIYTVNFIAGPNGKVDGKTVQFINHGSSFTAVTAVPNQNCHFVNWTGFITDTVNPLPAQPVTADMDITANFEHDTNTLTMAVSGGGTTSPVAESITEVNTVTPFWIQAFPEPGCSFAGWSVIGNAGVLDTDSPITTVTLFGNATVKAHFITGTVASLMDKVAVGPLSAIKDGMNVFKITVPALTTSLNITTSGGTGDCDIYAKLGSAPTLMDYYDKAIGPGPDETLNILNPAAGTWYIMLYGYEAYDGVSLLVTLGTGGPEKVTGLAVETPIKTDRVSLSWTAAAGATSYEVWRSDVNDIELAKKLNTSIVTEIAYDDVFSVSGEYRYYYWVRAVNDAGVGDFSSPVYGTNTASGIVALTNGTPVTLISGTAGSVKTYSITVPDALQTLLEVSISGGTGDCDIDVVKPGGTVLRRSVRGTSNELIQIQPPISAGAWLINLRGQTTYSALTLLAKFGKTVPAAPSGLTASDGLFEDRILLNWTAAAGATSYEVWRGIKASPTDATGPAVNIAEVADNTYEDLKNAVAPVPGTTYYYFLKAKNASGPSLFSSGDPGYLMKVPLAISSVTATNGTYFDKIAVTWPKVTDAASYELYRATSPTKTVTAANQAALSGSCVITATAHGFADKSTVLTSGLSGTLATVLNGKSFAITAVATDTFTVTVPANTTARTGTGGTAIPAGLIAKIAYNSQLTTYTYNDTANIADANPNPINNTYYYWVKALNGNGGSSLTLSSIVGSIKKTGPTSATATAGTLFGKIKITWAAVPGATGYEVYRYTNQLCTLGEKSFDAGANLFYEDTDATIQTPNTTDNVYYYKVKAKYFTFYTSDFSIPVVSGYHKYMPGPSSVTASAGTYFGKIHLTWAAVTGATSYDVYRYTDALCTQNQKHYDAGAFLYFDDTEALAQTPGTTNNIYYYKLKARFDLNNCTTNFSSVVSGYHKSLAGPATITASAGTLFGKVRVTWSAVAGAESYDVYRYTDKTLLANQTIFHAGTNLVYDDTTVAIGTGYYYTVRAIYDKYTSNPSAAVPGYAYAGATIASLGTPTLTASKDLYTYVKLSWTEIPLAENYIIYRSTSSVFATAAPLPLANKIPGLGHNDATANPGILYYYWIKSNNDTIPKTSPQSATAVQGRALPAAATVIANNGTDLFPGLKDSCRYYSIAVPPAATRLVATLTGTSSAVPNDCDIYAKLGACPTTTAYNAKGVESAGETLSVSNPAAGTWYFLLYGVTDYTNVTLKVNFYSAMDIVLTQVPVNDLAVPFTVSFKGRVVDDEKKDTVGGGIAGLSIQVRNPITGIISLLPAKTDATGFFTYSALINTEGEHTFDFFFTTMPDLAKGTASHTVATRKGCLEANKFFDFSAYLPATPITLSTSLPDDLAGMQTFLDIRNGWTEGFINTDFEKMWIGKTVAAASEDTALLGKLDEGLYMFFYGVEGAGVGNDTTANSAFSAVPFVVHVDSSKLSAVVSNLNTPPPLGLGIIDDTQAAAILIGGKIGVVTVATHSNSIENVVPGDKNIYLLAREQLEVLANLAAGAASENLIAPEGNKYSDVITKKFSVDLNSETKKINVKTSAFVK